VSRILSTNSRLFKKTKIDEQAQARDADGDQPDAQAFAIAQGPNDD
jgi:hypothetical protein